MIIEKNFEITLNIINPINFCANKEKNVLTEINNIYVTKCYMGCYIIKINEINQISQCRIITSNSSSNGVIDVKFTANVCIINEWDIIIGSKIIKNSSLIISLYQKQGMDISITFKPTQLQMNTFSLGQLVPIRVIKSAHKPKTNQIAVAGVLLTCDTYAPIYRVKGTIHKQYLPEIELLLNSINEELQLRTDIMKTKKKEVIFFENLIYAYKTPPSIKSIELDKNVIYEGTVIDNAISLFKMINTDLTGYWSKPLSLYRSSPTLVMNQEKVAESILTSPHLLFIDFAIQVLSFLKAIRELVETYNTPELIKSHDNIWHMMKSRQI
jgi:hypothetical protein